MYFFKSEAAVCRCHMCWSGNLQESMVSYHVDPEDQTQVVLVAKTPLPLSQSQVGQVGLNFPHTSPCLIYTVPGSEPRTEAG